RLDVEVAAHDLLPGLVQTIGAPTPECREDGAVVVAGAELRSDPEQSREGGSPKESRPVMVDLILETRKALCVRTGLAFQHNRAAIRHDESRPDEQDSVLPEGDLAIVYADELRALWNEEISPGRAVIDILRHLGSNLTGESGP